MHVWGTYWAAQRKCRRTPPIRLSQILDYMDGNRHVIDVVDTVLPRENTYVPPVLNQVKGLRDIQRRRRFNVKGKKQYPSNLSGSWGYSGAFVARFRPAAIALASYRLSLITR